jgi:Fe-S-cluster containining protein
MRLSRLKKIKVSKKIWDTLPALIKRGKVEWQSDTPTRFLCSPGCRNCCGGTFYTLSEFKTLPMTIKAKLVRSDEVSTVFHIEKINGKCAFYIPNEDHTGLTHGCSIHGHEPMRCRIFPYLPILSQDRIFITSETFCNVYDLVGVEKYPHDICFGLGNGKRGLKTIVIKMCREYLMSLYQEYPDLLKEIMFEEPVKLLHRKYINMQINRKYKTYEDAIPALQHADSLKFGRQVLNRLAKMLQIQ